MYTKGGTQERKNFLINIIEGVNTHQQNQTSTTMADLEAVLADVSYLMAMEKSKCTPAARASKKIILPDPRCCLSPFPVLADVLDI